MAIAFELTGIPASDSPLFTDQIEAGPDEAPRAVVADKGYDSDANRTMARERGAVPVVPHRSNRKAIPPRMAKALYRGRARTEQMMGKSKRFNRVALRCENAARNHRSIVAIAATVVLLKSVHNAWDQHQSVPPHWFDRF